MNKFFCSIFVPFLLLSLTGCFPKSSSADQIATGVAKTVAAKNTGGSQTNLGGPTQAPPTKVVTKAATKIINKPQPATADFRQAALAQFLGTWKVTRVNKSGKGAPWQDVGNQLTFQQDGTFEMAGINGSFTTAKFRVDLKQVGFTFDDGKKEYWNFTFTQSDNSLTLVKQGSTERFDMSRVQ